MDTIENKTQNAPNNYSIDATNNSKPSNIFGGKSDRKVNQFHGKDGPGPG